MNIEKLKYNQHELDKRTKKKTPQNWGIKVSQKAARKMEWKKFKIFFENQKYGMDNLALTMP